MRYLRLLEILLIDESESDRYHFLTQIVAPVILPEKLIVTKSGIVFRGEFDDLVAKVAITISLGVCTKLDIFSEHLTLTEIPNNVKTAKDIEQYMINSLNLLAVARNIVHNWIYYMHQ